MVMNLFDAPIPGQSLTQQPGSSPWEMPPKFTSPDDALEFTFEKLTNPAEATKLALMLKKGIPAEYIANNLLFVGASQALWNMDVALLIKKTLVQQIVSVGHLLKVKNIKIKNSNPEQDKFYYGFLDLIEKPTEVKQEEVSVKEKPKLSGLFGAL